MKVIKWVKRGCYILAVISGLCATFVNDSQPGWEIIALSGAIGLCVFGLAGYILSVCEDNMYKEQERIRRYKMRKELNDRDNNKYRAE